MNMNQLVSFMYEDEEVQVVDIDGEPWFVAKSLDKILGFKSTSDIARKTLNPNEYRVKRVYAKTIRNDINNGKKMASPPSKHAPRLLVISESGLYTLIMRSWKPEAKKFREWITSDVIPSLRISGVYMMDHGRTENYSVNVVESPQSQELDYDSAITIPAPEPVPEVISMNLTLSRGSLAICVKVEEFNIAQRSRIINAIQDIIDEIQ